MKQENIHLSSSRKDASVGKKRGRPKKVKKIKKISLICGLCKYYRTVSLSKRNEEKVEESSYRKIYTRTCKPMKKEVDFNFEACDKFEMASIIGCGSETAKSYFCRMYTAACIKKLLENNDECKKCSLREVLLKYAKETNNGSTDKDSRRN